MESGNIWWRSQVGGNAMIPNNANNNTFDWLSAVGFYAKMQESGVPLISPQEIGLFLSDSIYVYDKMEATGNSVGSCSRDARSLRSRNFGKRLVLSRFGYSWTLPLTQPQVFISVFAVIMTRYSDGEILAIRWIFQSLWSINFIAAIPELRERFFEPVEIKLTNATHLVIGVSRNSTVSKILMLAPIFDGYRDIRA